jgi:hypothetical protein
MGRWVLIIIGGSLALCLGCVVIGVFVVRPRAQSAVASAMADAIATSAAGSISTSALATGELVLTADDLDVNNAISYSGSCGISVTNQETAIYGITTEITPAGIFVGCEGGNYSAVPVVKDGRVEITEIEVSTGVLKVFLSKNNFEKGMEEGINRALAANKLTPIAITLDDGAMTILTEGAAT